MTHIRNFLRDRNGPGDGARYTTGFADLDELTGGLSDGELWLVTGTPGQGCTTLLTQWAASLAVTHHLPTWLLSARESTADCTSRLLASAGRIPLRPLLSGDEEAVDAATLRHARSLFEESETFVKVGSDVSLPSWYAGIGARALLVDDADLVASATPERLRSKADDGAVVIASVPRHVLVRDQPRVGDLDPHWARVADVILEVRSRVLDEASLDERMGEAELTVLKHRRGPVRMTTVAFQGHHARFVDLRR